MRSLRYVDPSCCLNLLLLDLLLRVPGSLLLLLFGIKLFKKLHSEFSYRYADTYPSSKSADACSDIQAYYH